MLPIKDALEAINAVIDVVIDEAVDLADSCGRILSADVNADVDSPPHRKSVMDGYAVISKDVHPKCELKVLETIIAGAVPQHSLLPGTCSRIMTGAPMPDGADAVVMIEHARQDGETVRFEIDSIEAGKHTLDKAASFGKGEVIFQAGHKVRALDVGLLAEVGAHRLPVKRNICAAVLPTGNELVGAAEIPGPGQIRNSNGPMLVSLMRNAGLIVDDLGVAKDDRNDLEAKIVAGLQADLLVLSGGVSAGTMDLVPEILQKSGVKQIFHKVRVKPGKPVWFGVKEKEDGKCYVFGLPGNPVSSLVGFELFVIAAIRLMQGGGAESEMVFNAQLAADHQARGDRPTYWPAVWQESEGQIRTVTPLRWMGSSDLRALGSANALVFFPSAGQYAAGQSVRVYPIY